MTYATENVWVEYRDSTLTPGSTLYTLVLSTGDMALTASTGRLTVSTTAVYMANLAVSLRRDSGSGLRLFNAALSVNGSASPDSIAAATETNPTDWVGLSGSCMISLTSGDTVSVFLNEVQEGSGTVVTDIEVAQVTFTLTRVND